MVASHARADRLRTLLDALALQTLARERFEVVVVHTYGAEVSGPLLDAHELGREDVLRHARLDGGEARPSRQRNAGSRMARGDHLVFTDDDCRPEPRWLERLVSAAGTHPGKIVQGATVPDPREEHLFACPHVRTLRVDPPSREVQTCNVLYPRELLERVGGFDERAVTGEDIDLSIRARDAGAGLVAVPSAVTYHAIEALSLAEKVRSQHKWRHLAYVVKRHPALREWCRWGIWWKEEHWRAALALAALAAAPRSRGALLGVLPYVAAERHRHGPAPAQQLRALRELPAHWVVELAEIGSFALGSIRHRTLLL